VASARMHPDEAEIDVALVDRLVAAQFPEWADLPIERVRPPDGQRALPAR
jgi:hypothetical protein